MFLQSLETIGNVYAEKWEEILEFMDARNGEITVTISSHLKQVGRGSAEASAKVSFSQKRSASRSVSFNLDQK